MHELPEQFAMLQPLDKWIVGDDVDRSDLMSGATYAELEDLIAAVEPHVEAINAYLDEHQDEAACNPGIIAEPACEAQLDLARRTKNA